MNLANWEMGYNDGVRVYGRGARVLNGAIAEEDEEEDEEDGGGAEEKEGSDGFFSFPGISHV